MCRTNIRIFRSKNPLYSVEFHSTVNLVLYKWPPLRFSRALAHVLVNISFYLWLFNWIQTKLLIHTAALYQPQAHNYYYLIMEFIDRSYLMCALTFIHSTENGSRSTRQTHLSGSLDIFLKLNSIRLKRNGERFETKLNWSRKRNRLFFFVEIDWINSFRLNFLWVECSQIYCEIEFISYYSESDSFTVC